MSPDRSKLARTANRTYDIWEWIELIADRGVESVSSEALTSCGSRDLVSVRGW